MQACDLFMLLLHFFKLCAHIHVRTYNCVVCICSVHGPSAVGPIGATVSTRILIFPSSHACVHNNTRTCTPRTPLYLCTVHKAVQWLMHTLSLTYVIPPRVALALSWPAAAALRHAERPPPCDIHVCACVCACVHMVYLSVCSHAHHLHPVNLAVFLSCSASLCTPI